jgi:hypothetical protein
MTPPKQEEPRREVQRIIIEFAAERPQAAARQERWAGLKLLALAVALIVAALLALRFRPQWPELLPLVLGVLGGILHEVTQSGGVLHLPQKLPDGQWYLGSLLGGALGGVAAIGTLAAGLDSPIAAALGGFSLKGGLESGMALGKVRSDILDARVGATVGPATVTTTPGG